MLSDKVYGCLNQFSLIIQKRKELQPQLLLP